MKKISVIIPVYNVSLYLRKCLDSIINQTLRDIEVICINDGSTDNSLEILNEYAVKDDRIKIINQENKKQGAARNAGMRIATGEYIGFVDSDDWVDLDFYEKLYNTAKKHNFDIALGTNVRVKKNGNKKRLNITEEKEYTSIQDKFDVNVQWKNPCPTNKIYKRDLFLKHNIQWPEGVYCEDRIFTLKAVYYANGIVTVPNVNYYYFSNPNSTVNFKKGKHNQLKRNDRDDARCSVLKFLKENKAQLRDKDFWAVMKKFKIFGINLYQINESIHTEKHLIFGLIPLFEYSFEKGNL